MVAYEYHSLLLHSFVTTKQTCSVSFKFILQDLLQVFKEWSIKIMKGVPIRSEILY